VNETKSYTKCSGPPKKHFCLFLIIPMVYERKKLNIPIWFMRKKLKSEKLMDANDVNDNKHKWMTIHHMVQLFFFYYKFLVGISIVQS
jgi:hypothetical protein